MAKGFLKRSLHGAAVLSTSTSMLLVLGIVEIEAAKSRPTTLFYSISPDEGSTVAGVAIRFNADTQGGRGFKSYSCDLSDGSGGADVATDKSVDVTYSMVGGPFVVHLPVAAGRCNVPDGAAEFVHRQKI